MDKGTNILERDAEWNENNLLNKAVSMEIERIQLNLFYNILRRQPQQPIQLWQECDGVTPTDDSELAVSSPITLHLENDGIFEMMPVFTITPNCCICAMEGPVTFTDGTRTLVYTGDVCGKLTFYPNGVVMEDDKYDRSEHLSGDWPLVARGGQTLQ